MNIVDEQSNGIVGLDFELLALEINDDANTKSLGVGFLQAPEQVEAFDLVERVAGLIDVDPFSRTKLQFKTGKEVAHSFTRELDTDNIDANASIRLTGNRTDSSVV